MQLLKKIFGDQSKKFISKLQKNVGEINDLEDTFNKLSTDQLKNQTAELVKRIKDGKKPDELLPEAFALVREASKRTKELRLRQPIGALGLRHFDVQLIGGMVLHLGNIAEMKTGEGKTLVATLAAYLNALEKKGVHIVTVNDYLARRDAVWMGTVYHTLGLTIGCIQHDKAFLFDPAYESAKTDDWYLRPVTRREAYAADIIYGTNNEFGFDYLRDNMVQTLAQKVQRGLHYAIVDEIDSILIDEARTPLIISAPAEQATEQYYRFAQLVEELRKNEDYNVDEKMRAVTLSEVGIKKLEKALGLDNIYHSGGVALVHHIEQALKARALFKKDRDYIIKEGEIIIVDEFTGRLMPGRRYSEGLHQAIEAKENVKIKQESITLATITFQNYFRLYDKLSGMTGTAATEAEEFQKIYNLDVIEVPTYRPINRNDRSDRIYKSEEAKFQALVKDIKERHSKDQPVLIGTISIEKNEYLSKLLTREGIPYELLNAKNHAREAAIIAQAGKPGAVTVATNMAGRGTDIILGGNPPDSTLAKKVREVGGLMVIGSERHEARRIDNQLRGRSGRLGDPGETQFYVSMEDDLMRIFGSERIQAIMTRLGLPDDVPIENKMISGSIATAQKKVEGRNCDIRKHLVEFDDVINKHREVIYQRRNRILSKDEAGLKKEIKELIQGEIETVVSFHTSLENEKSWNMKEIYEVVNTIFPITDYERQELEKIHTPTKDKLEDAGARTKIINFLNELAEKKYQQIEEKVGNSEIMSRIERSFMLRAIDVLWIEHLDTMQHLREGIGLQGYGQRDPLIEYKKEGYKMFTELIASINKQIVYSIFKFGNSRQAELPASPMQGRQILRAPAKTMNSAEQTKAEPVLSTKAKNDGGEKIGRNDPCFCGSGKKYKKCHGA